MLFESGKRGGIRIRQDTSIGGAFPVFDENLRCKGRLALEVVIEGPLGDACGRGNVLDAARVIPLFDEQFRPGFKNHVASARGAKGPATICWGREFRIGSCELIPVGDTGSRRRFYTACSPIVSSAAIRGKRVARRRRLGEAAFTLARIVSCRSDRKSLASTQADASLAVSTFLNSCRALVSISRSTMEELGRTTTCPLTKPAT